MRTKVIFGIFVTSLLLPGRAWAACSGSGLSWSCTSGSTVAQVQSAIDSASDGATITFAAGSYSWPGGLTLSETRGVDLVGAGIDQSIVTGGSPVIGLFPKITGTNSRRYRISGFTFQNVSESVIWVSKASEGLLTMTNLRIHNNKFQNLSTGSIAIMFGTPEYATKMAPAVIDNNIFTGSDQTWGAFKYMGARDMTNWPSSVRGTNANVFIEDNTFSFSALNTVGIGSTDSWSAASVVIRFNTVRNAILGSHGVSHGGMANWEAYRNTMSRTAGTFSNGYRMIVHQGSGEISIWGNTFSVVGTINSDAMNLLHYRSASPAEAGYDSYMGRCDGTSSRDRNFSPSSTYYGYPCWMQPGRAPAGGSPIYGTHSPMYFFLNINQANGSTVPVVIDSPWSGPPYVTTHVVANRDFFQAVSPNAQTSPTSPFNGATGMGYGTLANRPTTCTTSTLEPGGGVGYWATDQGYWNNATPGTPGGVLYRCSAPNTWTQHYVPYAYPHPMRNASLPAPTNLRIQ